LGDILPLYYTKLVKSGFLSMSELVKLTSYNPSKIIHKDTGKIKVDSKARLVLFDTSFSYTIDNPQSLYHKEDIQGKVLKTFR